MLDLGHPETFELSYTTFIFIISSGIKTRKSMYSFGSSSRFFDFFSFGPPYEMMKIKVV
jgi:hypothetical protein